MLIIKLFRFLIYNTNYMSDTKIDCKKSTAIECYPIWCILQYCIQNRSKNEGTEVGTYNLIDDPVSMMMLKSEQRFSQRIFQIREVMH